MRPGGHELLVRTSHCTLLRSRSGRMQAQVAIKLTQNLICRQIVRLLYDIQLAHHQKFLALQVLLL